MSQNELASAKGIKVLQQSLYTPTKFLRHSRQTLRTHETLNSLQPKVLDLIRAQAVDRKC